MSYLSRISIVLMGVSLVLVAMVDPVTALEEAQAPEWEMDNYWDYEGTLLIIEMYSTTNVTGTSTISVNGSIYNTYVLDVYIEYTLGSLKTSISGKDYFELSTYHLVKSERTSVEKGDIKNKVITYDPPKKVIDFPLYLGKRWDETVTVTTVETYQGHINTTVETVSTTYEVAGVDVVNTDRDDIECFRIEASNEGSGGSLEYWYSADCGNFVKMDLLPEIGNSEVTLMDYWYEPEGGNGGGGGGGGSSWGMLWVFPVVFAVIIIMVFVAVLFFVARKRRGAVPGPAPPTPPTPATVVQPSSVQATPQIMIEDYFLISKDGRLIHHDARRLKPDVDQQVLGGMFTAIQEFITQSFPSSDGTTGPVREIRYGNSTILIESGQHIYLAAVTEMKDISFLQDRMARLIKLMESKHANDLKDWDGAADSVTEAKRLSRMILTDEPIPEA